MPVRFILFTPHHAFRRPIHNHARPLNGSLHIDFALPRSCVGPMRSATITVIRQLHAPTVSIFLCVVELPLDARQEVKVSVDAGRGSKVTALDVRGGVSDARALRPKLVALGTRKGASLGRAAGAAVFWGIGVTEWNCQRFDWSSTEEVISGNKPDSTQFAQ